MLTIEIAGGTALYLLFLDESGTPPKPENAAGRYLVICGLILAEATWPGIAKEFKRILRKYNIDGEIKWKYFGSSNNNEKNSLRHLSREQRDALRNELFGIITARKATKIICCVTSIEAAYNRPTIATQDDVYHLTYKAVTERFQYFLQDSSRITGASQFGIVVADHRMADDDKKLRRRHHQLIDTNEQYSANYANFIETIFFSPSEASVGLQLADMAAGAVQRYFQYQDDRFVRQILPAFRTSPNGDVEGWGLVKMPKGTFIEPSGGAG